MNLLGCHSELLEAKMQEAEKKAELAQREKEIDVRSAELFSEFGFDPDEMRRALAESSYQEFIETRDADFAVEYDKYTNPDLYTKSPISIFRAGPNCYAFAFQWERNPKTGDIFRSKPAPGEIAHDAGAEYVTRSEIMQYAPGATIKEYLEGKIAEDLDCCGLEMEEVHSPDHPLQEGEWIIAMVSARDVGGFPDFHFYRKGDAGTWYHKPGITAPTMLDASGKQIFDPRSCDRGPYDTFHGYYVVRPSTQHA